MYKRQGPAAGILRQALPLGLAGLCQQAYFYVDNVFVRSAGGEVPLGHYNAGVRLMSFLIMAAQYATLAGLPWLARRHARGDLGAAAARLAQPLFAGASLAAGLAWPWAGEILVAIFGGEGGFEAGGPSLRWLLLATALIYAGAPLLTAVVSTGSTGAVLRVTATALGVNLLGNAVLVPVAGIEGAAAATLATELVVAAAAPAATTSSVARVAAAAPSMPATGTRTCLLYTSPSPRDQRGSRMPSSA